MRLQREVPARAGRNRQTGGGGGGGGGAVEVGRGAGRGWGGVRGESARPDVSPR